MLTVLGLALAALAFPAVPAADRAAHEPVTRPSLAHVLALMDAAEPDTVSATVVDWADQRLRARAASRAARPLRPLAPDPSSVPGVLPFPPATCGRPAPATIANRRRILIDRPHRFFSDGRGVDGRRQVVSGVGRRSTYLSQGDVYFSVLPPGPRSISFYPAGTGTAQHMLRPRELARQLTLRVVGLARPGSGPAAVLTGRLRPGGDTQIVGGIGEDEVRLWVDLRRGVLVRLEYRFAGRPFLRTTISHLVVDRPIPHARFWLRPPRGARVIREPDFAFKLTTLADAAAHAGFAVFRPSEIDGQVVLSYVVIGVRGRGVRIDTGYVSIFQRNPSALDRCLMAGGRRVVRAGVDVSIVSQTRGGARVMAIRDGTLIEITGRGTGQRLAALLAALKRVN